jgi:hypothetical protein
MGLARHIITALRIAVSDGRLIGMIFDVTDVIAIEYFSQGERDYA